MELSDAVWVIVGISIALGIYISSIAHIRSDGINASCSCLVHELM